MVQTSKQFCALVFALSLNAASVAQASPPPPPPTAPPAAPFDICRDRSSLLYDRSYLFEIRPCTIKTSPKGRKLELASTSGPGPFKDASGKQHRPTKVVFRSFVPAEREAGSSLVAIKQTGRKLRVVLPNRLPSVLDPYVITLPNGICRADGWLVSVAVSDGTETKPFGVINSMCGPRAKR